MFPVFNLLPYSQSDSLVQTFDPIVFRNCPSYESSFLRVSCVANIFLVTNSPTLACRMLQFLSLAIVNTAAVNREVQISLQDSDFIAFVGLWTRGQFSFQFLEKLFCCTSFPFEATVYKGLLFSTSLPGFIISCLFYDNHSKRPEVIPHGVDLHFIVNQ